MTKQLEIRYQEQGKVPRRLTDWRTSSTGPGSKLINRIIECLDFDRPGPRTHEEYVAEMRRELSVLLGRAGAMIPSWEEFERPEPGESSVQHTKRIKGARVKYMGTTIYADWKRVSRSRVIKDQDRVRHHFDSIYRTITENINVQDVVMDIGQPWLIRFEAVDGRTADNPGEGMPITVRGVPHSVTWDMVNDELRPVILLKDPRLDRRGIKRYWAQRAQEIKAECEAEEQDDVVQCGMCHLYIPQTDSHAHMGLGPLCENCANKVNEQLQNSGGQA